MTSTTLHAGYPALAGSSHGGLTSRALIRLGTAFIAAGSSLASAKGADGELFHRHLERRTDLRAAAHSGIHLL
ncbi:hypothetical protein [Arthrobacter antioxidans]|uniref:hypothetical protein n=1 Tax=Arthrobacter antioxidans TaxID=2895818 RepID=UPI001FFE9FB4|nr:hypothetical protein [Arthrobacter antioxidans]